MLLLPLPPSPELLLEPARLLTGRNPPTPPRSTIANSAQGGATDKAKGKGEGREEGWLRQLLSMSTVLCD